MTLKVENEQTKYKNPGVLALVGGITAGVATGLTALTPHKHFSPKLLQGLKDVNDSLTQDQFESLQTGIKTAFDKSKLASKGVSILRATGENSEEVSQAMLSQFNKGLFKFYPKESKEFISSLFGNIIENGDNACYVDAAKKIVLPETKLNLAFFHEAGHAINANMSVFGKILQQCRPMALLALPIALIALLKTKKAPGEKPKNKLDAAGDFVKNNAGKLTLAAFAPMLIEEGLATIKGNKLAKEVLNPELASKVAKSNAYGYGTYALLALGISAGIFIATKIKDAIASRKAVKTEKTEKLDKAA